MLILSAECLICSVLRYLTHAEIDFTLWDSCVRQSSQSLIYAYAGYLEISTGGNWDAIVEFQEGRYVSVFPLPFKKRLGIYFIYQPFHTQQLGLFTTTQSTQILVAAYLLLIPPKFQKIYLQLNTDNLLTPEITPAGFDVLPRVTFHLDLNAPYEALNKGLNYNLKRSLKKAQKEPYSINKVSDLTDLIRLFQQTRGQKLKSVKTRHYRLFEKQYRFLKANQLGEIMEIRDQGELIAGALFLIQGSRIIFLFSAASETGRKKAAIPLILDAVIREHAGTAKILDFEGGSIPNLRRFYSSFGAKSVTYPSVSKNTLPWYFKWLIK